jgi:starch synthase
MALVILGTGEMHGALAEQLRTGTSRSCLAAQAFDPALAARLYAGGDLFLMPSDFEPCGISQMIAMRYGTVPVASAVGGLADTIRHEQTGFLFSGPNRTAAAEAFVGCVEAAVRKAKGQPKAWRALQRKAMECRFTWEDSAARYQALYAQVAR